MIICLTVFTELTDQFAIEYVPISVRINTFLKKESRLVKTQTAKAMIRMSRRDRNSPDGGCDKLSQFYKQRFGSHSPAEYMNIRILNIDSTLTKEKVRNILEDETRNLGNSEIKVMNGQNGDRLVYVNFEDKDSARYVRKQLLNRLQRSLGRNIVIDPAGVVRDNDGRITADRQYRNKSPVMQWKLKDGDADLSRTLFVGNLPADISEDELREVFARYGGLEDIDVKRPQDTNAAYSFIMFTSLGAARDAKDVEHNEMIRPDTRRCKIGYGKSQPSKRLWIGNLGDWANVDLIEKEFDRWGAIDTIDFVAGDDFGYVRYREQSAATVAYDKMNLFPLGGRHREIFVDYAKDLGECSENGTRTVSPPARPPPRKRKASSGSSRDGEPLPSGSISTVQQMDDEVACTWIGEITFKKTPAGLRLFRVAGSERLLQLSLRDDDGLPVPLSVSQRISLTGQEALETKMATSPRKGISVMVGLPKKGGDFGSLLRYLQEKSVAGMISLKEGATMYIYGPCPEAAALVDKLIPSIKVFTSDSGLLLCIVVAP